MRERGKAREGELGEASSGRRRGSSEPLDSASFVSGRRAETWVLDVRFLAGGAKVSLLADALSHSPTVSLDLTSGPTLTTNSIPFDLDAEY